MSATGHNALAAPELLNSWKEIAAYLNRGVRTVQRWEVELGLPVRHIRGRKYNTVMAFRSELDQWTRSCPITTLNPRVLSVPSPVVLKSRELRREVARLRVQLGFSVRRLLHTCSDRPAASPRARAATAR